MYTNGTEQISHSDLQSRLNMSFPVGIPPEGWVVFEPVATAPPEPTEQEIQAGLTRALNAHLDAVAGQRRYDSRFTCALRAGFPGPFQAEGLAFAAFMDQCNMVGYNMLRQARAGEIQVPTEAELIAAMPTIKWPPSPIPEGAA